MFLNLILQILSIFLLVLCESVLSNEGFSTELLIKQYAAPSTEEFVGRLFHFHNFTQRFFQRNHRLVSSVSRAPVCWAGGRGFKLRPDQHSEESAAFVMSCKRLHFLVFSDKDKKPWVPLTVLSLIWFLWDVKESIPLFEKSKGRYRP